MNRKQFLKTLGSVGTVAFGASAGASGGTIPAFRAPFSSLSQRPREIGLSGVILRCTIRSGGQT